MRGDFLDAEAAGDANKCETRTKHTNYTKHTKHTRAPSFPGPPMRHTSPSAAPSLRVATSPTMKGGGASSERGRERERGGGGRERGSESAACGSGLRDCRSVSLPACVQATRPSDRSVSHLHVVCPLPLRPPITTVVPTTARPRGPPRCRCSTRRRRRSSARSRCCCPRRSPCCCARRRAATTSSKGGSCA